MIKDNIPYSVINTHNIIEVYEKGITFIKSRIEIKANELEDREERLLWIARYDHHSILSLVLIQDKFPQTS